MPKTESKSNISFLVLSGEYSYYYTEVPQKILNLICEKGFKGFKEVQDYFDKNLSGALDAYLVKRDVENLIPVIYPPGAGGNFLINCLSLSPDIGPNIWDPSLNNSLSPNHVFNPVERCNFICSKYRKLKFSWDDVIIWPSRSQSMLSINRCKYLFDLIHKFKIYSNGQKKGGMNNLWKFWEKSDKIIIFKNSRLFKILRICSNRVAWASARCNMTFFKLEDRLLIDKKIFKKNKLDVMTYKNLPPEEKFSLQQKYNDKRDNLIQDYSYCNLKTKKQIYFWDTNWFLDASDFILNVGYLYDALELSGFDENLVSLCYNSWIEAIHRSEKNCNKDSASWRCPYLHREEFNKCDEV